MNDRQIRWVVSIVWPGGHRTFPIVGNPEPTWGLIRRNPEPADELDLAEAMKFAEKVSVWVHAQNLGAQVDVSPTRPFDGGPSEYVVRVDRDWAPPEYWNGHSGESFTLHEAQACCVPREAAEAVAAAIRVKLPDTVVSVVQVENTQNV